jgi:hypothetical protein
LFKRYLGLAPVVEAFLAEDRMRLVAKMDFTTKKLDRMPTGLEVRAFNGSIKRFWSALRRALGISPREAGLLYCDEFGGKNINLHAHAVYVGPPIPHSWFGKGGKLAQIWERACEETVFAGSRIVSVKLARSFGQGLGHALKYTGKFLDSDPVRLVDLEVAFHRVKRVHVLGCLYNKLPKEPDPPEPTCPDCESPLEQERRWVPVKFLVAAGRVDLDEARQDVRRRRGFGFYRNNYSAGGSKKPPW